MRIQNWDTKVSQDEDRVLYDYQLWRSARSITDFGGYRDASANLVGADSSAQPTGAAEVTACAGAAPVVLLGRASRDT